MTGSASAPQARGQILRLRRAGRLSRGPLNADVRRHDDARRCCAFTSYCVWRPSSRRRASQSRWRHLAVSDRIAIRCEVTCPESSVAPRRYLLQSMRLCPRNATYIASYAASAQRGGLLKHDYFMRLRVHRMSLPSRPEHVDLNLRRTGVRQGIWLLRESANDTNAESPFDDAIDDV